MVEIDHFQCGGINYLLITDRTFFYKQGSYVRNLTAVEAIRAFTTVWIRYFGPPRYTIVDQGSSLANTEFGAFCAKISSERIVAGIGTASSSARPAEHTHTGTVEKSVDLIRIAMVKIRAEAEENDIALTGEELIAEACAAHNCLLTYKGCTPVAGVLGINGTIDLFDMASTSPDAFGSPDPGDIAEKAVRLRHWAKIAMLRSVVEYRIARAQHTRPQQVNLAEITVGSYVDMYRRPAAKDLPGWRGPCRVLETNRDTGTAVVMWQGRPWLISLRHVRKHQGFIHAMAYYATSCASATTWRSVYLTVDENIADTVINETDKKFDDHHHRAIISLMKMMDMTDGSDPRRVYVFGNIWDEKRNRYVFVTNVPGTTERHHDMDRAFNEIAQIFLAIFPYSGVMFGTHVKRINPTPRAVNGYVICWDRTDRSNHEIYEIDPSKGFNIPHGGNRSFIMYYGYNVNTDNDPESRTPDVNMPELDDLPGQGHTGLDDMDADASMQASSISSLPSMTSSSARLRTPRHHRRMAEEIISNLDNRSKTKRRLDYPDNEYDLNAASSSRQPILPLNENHDNHEPSSPSDLSTIPYEDYQTAESDLDISESTTTTYEPDLPMLYAQFLPEINAALKACSTSATSPSYVIFNHDLYQYFQGRIFRVEEDTDNLTWRDLYDHEHQVSLADYEELESFSTHEVWHPVELKGTPGSLNVIDATWIRKWKIKDRRRMIKSRLCARGCFDRQKPELLRSSAVASRLSQKLLVSNAANHGWEIESLDVSTAFLRGLTFAEVDAISRDLGVPSPLTERRIHVQLPGNAWFWLYKKGHLNRQQWMLARQKKLVMCLDKCMYGLADAPLLWSLALKHWLVRHMGALQSSFDDCHFFWKDKRTNRLTGEATCHVDDNALSGSLHDLEQRRRQLESRFGMMSRQTTPFVHVGVHYDKREGGGYHLHQDTYCQAMKVAEVPRGQANEVSLDAAGTSALRAVLGALLYLTITRHDISTDVVLLASKVTTATYGDLRAANAVVRRAQRNPKRGVHFPKLNGKLCIFCISDASFSTKSTSYAVEGQVVLIKPAASMPSETGAFNAQQLTGPCHVISATARKAKRISHSTSHAESLSAYGALTAAETVALRQTEVNAPRHVALPMEKLIQMEQAGRYDMLIYHLTDCHDLVDLVVGHRGTPQDRSQRLIILSLRERRLIRKTAGIMWTNTNDMLANAMTKVVTSYDILHKLLDTGTLTFSHDAEWYPAPEQALTDYSEADLLIGTPVKQD